RVVKADRKSPRRFPRQSPDETGHRATVRTAAQKTSGLKRGIRVFQAQRHRGVYGLTSLAGPGTFGSMKILLLIIGNVPIWAGTKGPGRQLVAGCELKDTLVNGFRSGNASILQIFLYR